LLSEPSVLALALAVLPLSPPPQALRLRQSIKELTSISVQRLAAVTGKRPVVLPAQWEGWGESDLCMVCIQNV
jgi:hypothetical protein